MVLDTRGEISAFISSIAYVSVRMLEIELCYRDERGNVTERTVEPINYFRARDGKLSWEEIGTFQRVLYRGFSYETNQIALRPDEFLASGGGDCEDWSLVTAGLLRFWGYEPYIGSIRSLDDSQGHAVCLVKSNEKPQHSFYFRFKESGTFNGGFVGAGYYVPIDYDLVGGLSNAVGSNWTLKRVYVPERIYGAAM